MIARRTCLNCSSKLQFCPAPLELFSLCCCCTGLLLCLDEGVVGGWDGGRGSSGSGDPPAPNGGGIGFAPRDAARPEMKDWGRKSAAVTDAAAAAAALDRLNAASRAGMGGRPARRARAAAASRPRRPVAAEGSSAKSLIRSRWSWKKRVGFVRLGNLDHSSFVEDDKNLFSFLFFFWDRRSIKASPFLLSQPHHKRRDCLARDGKTESE